MMLLKYSCQVPVFPVDDVMWQKKPCFLLFSCIKSSENSMPVDILNFAKFISTETTLPTVIEVSLL